jgi:hypothetical protein
MLKNLFGLLLLEDAQSIQIKLNILVHWQYAALNNNGIFCVYNFYLYDNKGMVSK